MIKKPLLLFAILSTVLYTNAQKYTTAVGLRLGSGIGLTVQQHVFNKLTIEGTLQKNLFKDGTNVAVLAEHHQKIAFKGFNFYLGGGPHAELANATVLHDDKGNTYTINNNAYGVSAVAGLELRLHKLLISYDYQPGINLHGGEHIFNSKTGLSVRYILIKSLKKKKSKNDDWMFWKKWERKS